MEQHLLLYVMWHRMVEKNSTLFFFFLNCDSSFSVQTTATSCAAQTSFLVLVHLFTQPVLCSLISIAISTLTGAPSSQCLESQQTLVINNNCKFCTKCMKNANIARTGQKRTNKWHQSVCSCWKHPTWLISIFLEWKQCRRMGYSHDLHSVLSSSRGSHRPSQTFCWRSSISPLRSSHKGTAWSTVIKGKSPRPTWFTLSFWLCSCTHSCIILTPDAVVKALTVASEHHCVNTHKYTSKTLIKAKD